MVLERVEVTLVKNAHYILLEVEFLDDSLLIHLINSKEASRKTSKIWLKLSLLKDMETFQTLQTWIGHNATRYHNLNTLPYALPHALPYILSDIYLICPNTMCYHNFNVLLHVLSYIFSQFSMGWSYLQRVTTHYHHLKKTTNTDIYFFLN